MKKIKPSDLRRLAQAMIRGGSMPSLETMLQAVEEARQKYAHQVRASQKHGLHTGGQGRNDKWTEVTSPRSF